MSADLRVYPGTYCVSAACLVLSESRRICYGDASCENPTGITLTDTEVRTDVDFDFSTVGIQSSAWGPLKSLFR